MVSYVACRELVAAGLEQLPAVSAPPANARRLPLAPMISNCFISPALLEPSAALAPPTLQTPPGGPGCAKRSQRRASASCQPTSYAMRLSRRTGSRRGCRQVGAQSACSRWCMQWVLHAVGGANMFSSWWLAWHGDACDTCHAGALLPPAARRATRSPAVALPVVWPRRRCQAGSAHLLGGYHSLPALCACAPPARHDRQVS